MPGLAVPLTRPISSGVNACGSAAGAEGYAFDYWKVEGSDTPIYENPYTVTLTENTNFTAYFRERRVPAVNAETNGTAAFTYENSSGGADQYTLTATPDELYVFDYWSWEGVPTGAENSAPEEQALPDMKYCCQRCRNIQNHPCEQNPEQDFSNNDGNHMIHSEEKRIPIPYSHKSEHCP